MALTIAVKLADGTTGYIQAVSGAGSSGDPWILASDRATQTTLAAVLAKLTADPATATGVAAVLTELQAKADLTETQPVSAASLPLPSGAATSAKQDTLLTELQGKADLAETQPVSLASLPAVTGSVTANAGTNLNTSLLALETGGNLAGAATSLAVIDDWDETDRAKVNPIAGQAGVQGGAGAVTALTQRVALATDANVITDGGPSVAGTDTYTSSADMSTAADIGPAPSAGQKSVLLQATISVGTAMEFTIQIETTPAAERRSFLLPANGSIVFVPRYPIKLGTADKKWQGKASVAGQVRISTTTRSEA